eukprot:TRINITY_DN20563_c0_g1_i1.p2 TRINITY_DN20563_c0_g1~~TRINITY_DN20563_c0_g1_i1.p2  ORF type:complete len:107 (-),score=14.73 TRINITY_DN20563_c0_g1_i1:105-425(-)
MVAEMMTITIIIMNDEGTTIDSGEVEEMDCMTTAGSESATMAGVATLRTMMKTTDDAVPTGAFPLKVKAPAGVKVGVMIVLMGPGWVIITGRKYHVPRICRHRIGS